MDSKAIRRIGWSLGIASLSRLGFVSAADSELSVIRNLARE